MLDSTKCVRCDKEVEKFMYYNVCRKCRIKEFRDRYANKKF